jgi:Type VII secretion system ESX-1, transport TM domain B
VGSDTLAAADMATPRVDRDVVSRFATCCRALGLAVHDRQRPADLAAARSGFAAARPRRVGAGMTAPDDRRACASRTPDNENPDRVAYRRGFVTRHQVSGWRFVMRRIASGVALHDTRMLVDPLRTQTRAVLVGGLMLITGLAVVCALRSDDRPSAKPPVAGLTLLGGRQRPALNALNPLSAGRLETKPVPLHPDLLNGLHWRASRTATAAV